MKICSAFGKCGGCEFLDIAYSEQLAMKRNAIDELFSDISSGVKVNEPLGMDRPYHYRNKVATPYAPAKSEGGANGRKRRPSSGRAAKGSRSKGSGRADAGQRVLCGMYAKGTHDLVDTHDCLIENEIGTSVVLAVRDIMQKRGIEPYDEDSGQGFIRHGIVRVAQNTGEVLLTLVTNGEGFPNSRSFAREVVKRVPEVTTIVQNINQRRTNVILGERERALYGPGFILDVLCGLSVRISSQSFYQVNLAQTEVLYSKAIDMAKLSGSQTVLDAYCGAGVIGLAAAKRGAADVIGVECVGSAVEDAMQNASHNGIANARFIVADATEYMRDAAEEACGRPRLANRMDADDLVLMMDPPRAGATEAFLSAAADLGPARIVYISCNPKTQARDARLLIERGYRICEIQPVDMFPHTAHIENIISLERPAQRS